MAPVYLPDTAGASLAIRNLVYTYAQTVDVILIECKGTSSTAAQIYNYRGQSEIICYYEDDGVRDYAPKFPKNVPPFGRGQHSEHSHQSRALMFSWTC